MIQVPLNVKKRKISLVFRDIYCFLDSLQMNSNPPRLITILTEKLFFGTVIFLAKQRGTIHQPVFVMVPPSNPITNKQRIVRAYIA